MIPSYDSFAQSWNEGLKDFTSKSPEQRNNELIQHIANSTIQTFYSIMNSKNSYINIEENLKTREMLLPVLSKTWKSPEEINRYFDNVHPIQKATWNLLEYSEKYLQTIPRITDTERKQAMEVIREFYKNQEK